MFASITVWNIIDTHRDIDYIITFMHVKYEMKYVFINILIKIILQTYAE